MAKKASINRFLRSGILILLFCTCFPSLSSAMKDAIIAIVNDEVITLRDLHDYLDSVVLQLKLNGKSPSDIKNVMEEMKENGLKRLIEDKLIISEATRQGMEIREEFIDARIDKIKNNYASEEEFLDALLSEGATLTDLRNRVIDQLRVKYLIEADVKSKIHVNPQEVTDYYNNHSSEFFRPERVNLDSIFISKSGNPSHSGEKITEALALLKEGKAFSEVAAAYSERPSFGIIAKNQLLPEIEKAVFKLKTGAISPVIPVTDGFYIFKMKGKIDATVASLEQAKDDIYNKLFQIKFRERFEAWIAKLKKDAFIEIKE